VIQFAGKQESCICTYTRSHTPPISPWVDLYFLRPTTTVTSGLSLVKIIYKSALVSLLNCPEEQFGIVPQARESWGHVSRKIFTTSEIIASGSILA